MCWRLWQKQAHGSDGCAGDCGRSRRMVIMDVLGGVAEADAWYHLVIMDVLGLVAEVVA